MKICSVKGCTSKQKDKTVSFHRFPLKNPHLLKRWKNAIGTMYRTYPKEFNPTLQNHICSRHFTLDSYFSKHNKSSLKTDAVPTLFSHLTELKNKAESVKELEENSSSQSCEPSEKQKQHVVDNNLINDSFYVNKNGKIIINYGNSQITLDCDIVFSNPSKELIAKDKMLKNDSQEGTADDMKSEDNNESEEHPYERETRLLCDINRLDLENRKLKKTIQSVEKFLHKEQLEHLCKEEAKGLKTKWSEQCIRTCLQLKEVLGWEGYNYLLSIGYPGPVRNTLGKYLAANKCRESKTAMEDLDD